VDVGCLDVDVVVESSLLLGRRVVGDLLIGNADDLITHFAMVGRVIVMRGWLFILVRTFCRMNRDMLFGCFVFLLLSVLLL
jgi:hypothetical protein